MSKIITAEQQKAASNELDLEAIAKKFGAIPKDLHKKDDIITQGYMTAEEFELLPQCPRSKEMESATKWPYIGGRYTYPLSGTLTQEEKQVYYEYKRGLNVGSQGPRSPKVPAIDTTKLDALYEELKALPGSEKALDIVRSMYPADCVIMEVFGVPRKEDVEPCSGIYLLFRGPNGEFADDRMVDIKGMSALFMKGFMPKFTQDVLIQKVKELGLEDKVTF